MKIVVVTMYVLYLSAHQSHVSAVCAPKRVQGRGTSVGSESWEVSLVVVLIKTSLVAMR